MKATTILKRLLGDKLTKAVRPIGHGTKALLASQKYGHPARKLKIIGITGTKGKTTTTVFLGRLLNMCGVKTGYLSTATLCVDGVRGSEQLNPYKMTSIDSIAMQKLLSKMVESGCSHVVLEMSSEGLKQNRHWGLDGFDYTLFLNIYPEHLESHGGFDNYKKAKRVLFENMRKGGVMIANGNPEMIESSKFMAEGVKSVESTSVKYLEIGKDYDIMSEKTGINKHLKYGDKLLSTTLSADFELINLAFSIKTVEVIIGDDELKTKLAELDLTTISGVPGRMDWVIKDNVVL